jgi:hypothetical protein
VNMRPDETVVQGGLPEKTRARALSEPGQQYAIYIFGGQRVAPSLALPAGNYRIEWLSPTTGTVLKSETITAKEPTTAVSSPEFETDIALGIKRMR